MYIHGTFKQGNLPGNQENTMLRISGSHITLKFNRRNIFKDISFEVSNGSSLAISGPNGSGKTTLIRIICRLIRPTTGSVIFRENQKEIPLQEFHGHLGLVGPYLQLYNDLTALENYTFFTRIRGVKTNLSHFTRLMDRFGLKGREMDELKNYSSGLLQRAKYVMALLHQPQVLILDEPTSNLDEEGSEIVYSLMEEQKKDKILIFATNEPGELKYADEQIHILS